MSLNIICYLFLHFVSNFLITIYFKNKASYYFLCLLNTFLFCNFTLIIFFLTDYQIYDFFVVLYILFFNTLIYLQFYYGLITGISSDILYLIYKNGFIFNDLEKIFTNKKKQSIFFLIRLKNLERSNYIKIDVNKNQIYLTTKGKYFLSIYRYICEICNVNKPGDI